MNSKEKLKKSGELLEKFNILKNQLERTIITSYAYFTMKDFYKQKAKTLLEIEPEGCGKDTDCYGHPNINGGWKCGNDYLKREIIFCPTCKEQNNQSNKNCDEVLNG